MARPEKRRNEEIPHGRGEAEAPLPGLPETVPHADSLASLFDAMADCTRCDLARSRTQVVPGVGPEDARVMLIGEGPGEEEDRRGEPFVGRAGKLLDRLLDGAGLERESVFITNMVACRPPGNRTPRVREVKAHAPWIEEQIRLVAPEVIVTLGSAALTYFVPDAKITEVRGRLIDVTRDGRSIRLLPVVHPAAALRRRELMPDLERDFATVRRLLGRRGG